MSQSARPNSMRLSVLIPFAATTLIWGSTWIVIADQLGVVPPTWSVTYRFLLAGITLAGWALWKGEGFRLPPRGFAFAAVLGLFQFVLNFNFVYRAEAHVTSGLVAVVFALLLVPNAILGRIFLGQRLGRQLLVGSVIAVVGIVLLFLHEIRGDPSATREVLLGIGLTLVGVLCVSVANVMQATETARAFPMITTLGWAMLIAVAINALFALTVAGPPVIEWRLGYLLGVAWLGIAGSAIAFTLYFGVIRVIGPAKAAYSSVLVPVLAMLFSTLFEGYRWSWLAAAGALLAGVGLVTALSARRPAR